MAKPLSELNALASVLALLEKLDVDVRERLLRTVDTYFGRQARGSNSAPGAAIPTSLSIHREGKPYSSVQFSEQASITPKQFMLEKQPRTDVERVACLAFYLAHYRNMPQFKTIDISKLNSEAAQLKFANTAYSVANAQAAGYVTPAGRDARQISAAGERFVIALPDRDRAKSDMAAATLGRRGRQRNRRSNK